jgi:hypothetical protein
LVNGKKVVNKSRIRYLKRNSKNGEAEASIARILGVYIGDVGIGREPHNSLTFEALGVQHHPSCDLSIGVSNFGYSTRELLAPACGKQTHHDAIASSKTGT